MPLRQRSGNRRSTTARGPRGRLSRRLLAWFLLFSLVPLLVTNAIGYRRSHAIIERLVEQYLSTIARVQAQHIHDRLQQELLLLQAIAAGNEFLAAGADHAGARPPGPLARVASRAAIEHYLQHKLDELPAFGALYLFTPDGHVIAAVGDAGWIRAAAPPSPGRTLVARVADERRDGPPRFSLVVPVFGADDRLAAYLGATAGPTVARDFLQIPPHLAGHVESFIVDAAGRPVFVSHPHSAIDYGAPLATPLVALPAGAHARYRDREGADVIGTSAAVPGQPWRYLAEAPTAEALGALWQLQRLSLVLEVALGLLLAAAAWLVARGMVAPLARLVAATRHVGQGDLSVRVDVRGRDEIGELARAFNEMTAELSATTARVRELHQREIERAAQLATVGELASGIAHEIKNPVVGVSNGLDLVRRRVGEDTVLTPIMEEMARQLARVQQTLQELLAFARPATPTLAPVSGNHVLERAIRLVQPAASRAGVRIEARPDPALPRFPADEEMLRQAIVNLLMNAVEATPAGGRVVAATRAADDHVELTITDTGRGIPAAELEHVFKPFYTTRHTGTGLGLPISREIVERHGGRIALESTRGAGTRVTVTLPIHAVAPGRPHDAREALAR